MHRYGSAFALACGLASFACGQDGNFPVALLNADKVIKQYPGLQDRLQPVRQDVVEMDKAAQLKQVELETTQRQLQRTQPGTPDFEKLQVLLVKLQTELRQFIDRERRNIAKREAVIYADAFREMEEEVKTICKARGIKLVIRQVDASLNDERPEEVLKAINRAILYDDNLDITEEVMTALKKRAEKK